MDRTVDRTVIDRNTVPNLRKPYKLRWCTVITVLYRITVNRTVHHRVTTLMLSNILLTPGLPYLLVRWLCSPLPEVMQTCRGRTMQVGPNVECLPAYISAQI